MRSIIILNSKGGCGKSTIATNLAGYFADRGKRVVLADFDPQGSSLDWVAARAANRKPIKAVAAWRPNARLDTSADYLIMDTPAGVHGRDLSSLLRRAENILIPVLPSPMDTRAASHFLDELRKAKPITNSKLRIATVANRVRDYTIAAWELEEYLNDIKLGPRRKVPVIAWLRASQNYVRAANRGLSVFEMAPYATHVDREQWKPLLRWVQTGKP